MSKHRPVRKAFGQILQSCRLRINIFFCLIKTEGYWIPSASELDEYPIEARSFFLSIFMYVKLSFFFWTLVTAGVPKIPLFSALRYILYGLLLVHNYYTPLHPCSLQMGIFFSAAGQRRAIRRSHSIRGYLNTEVSYPTEFIPTAPGVAFLYCAIKYTYPFAL